MPPTTDTTSTWANESRPAQSPNAMLLAARPRTASQASMTRLRSTRSRIAPAGRVSNTMGKVKANIEAPAAAGEPVMASTSRGVATDRIRVPSAETSCPAQ